jgi:hypothetical protein
MNYVYRAVALGESRDIKVDKYRSRKVFTFNYLKLL